jgi:hypothetical protein
VELLEHRLQPRVQQPAGLEHQPHFRFARDGTLPAVGAVDGLDLHAGGQPPLNGGAGQPVGFVMAGDRGENGKHVHGLNLGC